MNRCSAAAVVWPIQAGAQAVVREGDILEWDGSLTSAEFSAVMLLVVAAASNRMPFRVRQLTCRDLFFFSTSGNGFRADD